MTDKLREAAQQALEAIERACRTAMTQTLKARIPECGEFGGIAQDLDFVINALRAALAQQDAQAVPQPSPTAGMNIAQRILHVGGRNNAAGYVEFGSTQAVEALVRQVIRDLPELVELENLRHNVNVYREATALTLNAAPTPPAQQDAQAIPDVCQGTNCGVADGLDHSPECIVETAEAQGWGDAPEAVAARQSLNAAPTPPAPKPLGWLNRKAVECLQGSELNWMPAWNRPTSSDPVPVFLGPPAQRVMLTDEEVLDLWSPGLRRPALGVRKVVDFARAVIEAYERKNGKEAA